MKHLNIILLSLLGLGLLGSCKKDNSDFAGEDNFIASFALTKDGITLNASIAPGEIVIMAPESFSLAGAKPAVVISENAAISPDPATITDWAQETSFTVTAYNGTKATYKYSVQRKAITKEGDVVLLTQADVEALAALKPTQINGSLTIGAATGKDSVYSLAPLSTLKQVRYGLTINGTYAGTDLGGLTNLERVGALQVVQNYRLQTIELPRLTTVVTDLVLNQVYVRAASFPALTSVEKGLQILTADSLVTLQLPKLKTIVENLTLTAGWSTNKLGDLTFPALEKVGGAINITNWKEMATLGFPQLATAGGFTVSSVATLKNLSAPKLQSVAGLMNITANTEQTILDCSALKTIGGDSRIESLALVSLDGLKALTSVGGELFVSNLTAVTSIQGLKALKTIGKRLYISNLPLLEDETLSGLANVQTIGTELTISQVPFKRFTGFSLTQVENMGIYGIGLSTIESIDVSNLTVTNTLIISNITTPLTLKGKPVFTGNLTFESSNLSRLEGFTEVNNLLYNMTNNAQAERVLTVQRVNGQLSLNIYGFSTFKMPLLEEVKGLFSMNTAAGLQTVEFPLLKKAGSATLDAAILPSLNLPALQTVNGNLTITAGKYQADNLSDLQLPALTTVNGILRIAGSSSTYSNSKLKNLHGLAALKTVNGVNIVFNTGLTDFSGIKGIIPMLGAGTWTVANNSYNPTYQNMVDGQYTKP